MPAPVSRQIPSAASAPATSTPGFTKIGKLPAVGSQDPKQFLTPEGLDIFDLKAHPNSTIVQPLDPATLTESEQKYGRSPHPDPKVEYQPGIILMEEGHKAIRGYSTNGLFWDFDANAPHVNEFEKGKIVFATSRAVGKILYMKRQGDTVTVLLGPIQIMDVIRRGQFAMNAPLDMSRMLPFIAPDFPQAKEEEPGAQSQLDLPDAHSAQTVTFSGISASGKWTPFSRAKLSPDGHRTLYRKVGKRWVLVPQTPAPGIPEETSVAAQSSLPPRLRPASATWTRSAGELTPGRPRLRRAAYQILPGTGLQVPTVPYMPDIDVPRIPNIPTLNLDHYMSAIPIGTFKSLGVKWSYERDGVGLTLSAVVQFDGAHFSFFLDVGKPGAAPIECGIDVSATISAHLQIKAHTTQEYRIGAHRYKPYWMPLSFSIPLSSNVPLAVNFDQALSYGVGMSAKNAVLDAEGEYIFTGGIKAGYYDKDFHISIPTDIQAKTDIAKSAQGISVGINSMVMAAELRTTAGLGAAGFSTGVYAGLVFSGTILRAPDIGRPCRAGTIESNLHFGLGYSLPGWLTDAINAVISVFTDERVDKAGSFLSVEPATRLWHGKTSIPDKCAGG